MKKFVIATTIIAFASLPVCAHSQDKGPATARTEKETKEDKEIDKAYRDTMKSFGSGGQAANSDPWKTIRPLAGTDKPKN